MKRVLFLLFLVLSLPLVQAGSFDEWVSTQPPLVAEENSPIEQTSQQCIAKAEQTNDILEALDSGIYEVFKQVTQLMGVVCQINGTITFALDLLNMFMGCICTLDIIPGGTAACESLKSITFSWNIAGVPVSEMCCYFTNGLCGLAACAESSDPGDSSSNANNQGNAKASAQGSSLTRDGASSSPQSSPSDTGGEGGGIGGVVDGLTSKENSPSLTDGISPYDNVYLAAACMSPGAMVHHIETLKTIYKTQECCVRQACQNELSPSMCDDSFQENVCTFFEGSFLGSIVGWLAYQATYRVVSFLIQQIAEAYAECIGVFADLIQVPDMLDGISGTLATLEDLGKEVSCEDLGFNFKKINEEKKLKTDSSEIDELDKITLALEKSSYVVDKGYNVRYERDYTSRPPTEQELGIIRSSLDNLEIEGKQYRSDRFSIYENAQGKKVVRVDGYLGNGDPREFYLGNTEGSITTTMRLFQNAEELTNFLTLNSPRYSTLSQDVFVQSKSELQYGITPGSIVYLPDGVEVDTSQMEKQGNTYVAEGKSLRLEDGKIIYSADGTTTTYSDEGKITLNQGVTMITPYNGQSMTVPTQNSEVYLKAAYVAGLSAIDFTGASVTNNVLTTSSGIKYDSNSNTVTLKDSVEVPAQTYLAVKDAQSVTKTDNVITATSTGKVVTITDRETHAVVSEKVGDVTTYKVVGEDRRGFESVSESVADRFSQAYVPFGEAEYGVLNNFGNDVSKVVVSDQGVYSIPQDDAKREGYVDYGTGKQVYSYDKQEGIGIGGVGLFNSVKYSEVSDPNSGSKQIYRMDANELSVVNIGANGEITAKVIARPESVDTSSLSAFIADAQGKIAAAESDPAFEGREEELVASATQDAADLKELTIKEVRDDSFGPQINLFGVFEAGLQLQTISLKQRQSQARRTTADFAARSVADISSGIIENAICQEEVRSSAPRTQEPVDSAITANEYCTQPLTSLTAKILDQTPIRLGYSHDFEYSITACKEDIYFRVSLGTCQTGCSLVDVGEGRANNQDPPLIVQESFNASILYNWICIETSDDTIISPYCVPFELDPVDINLPPPIDLPYACPVGFSGPQCLKIPANGNAQPNLCEIEDDLVLSLNSASTQSYKRNKIQYSYSYEVANCLEGSAPVETSLTLYGEGIQLPIERLTGDNALGFNQTKEKSGWTLQSLNEFTKICLQAGDEEVCNDL